MKTINLKLNSPSVDEAMAILTTEIEVAALENEQALKVIHGYGSHGKGGQICQNVHNLLKNLKNSRKITDFLLGNEWDLSNPRCMEYVLKYKISDEDLFRQNPGITIIII